MVGFSVTKLGPCGTPPHWHYKVRIGRICDLDPFDVVFWCKDQFGEPRDGGRWTYFVAEAAAIIILIHNPDDAFAIRMRWS